MYTDFHDQNGNPVAASVVLEAIKNPIIKHSVAAGIVDGVGSAPLTFFTEEDIIRNSLIFTNSCASDGIKLGSVNIGMAKMTVSNEKFKSFREPSVLIDKLIQPIFYLDIDENTKVTVMGGDYWIKEVEQYTEGVKLTCYDSMCKLDEPFTLGTITGTPYQIFTQAATACGLTVSTTQAEMEALPNGTRTFTLHSDNDCKTWRDVLSYLSMLMGCFVTMGRHAYRVSALPGIEVHTFGNGKASFCDTVTDVHRYKGAKFSIFDTEYKAIDLTAYVVDGQDTVKKDFTYAETTGVTGQTIKLGYNPFIQADTPEADLTQTQRDILHELLTRVDKYAYTPMQISLPVGFIYDLGDVIKCTGGLANTGFAGGYTEDCYCCISNYTYTYGKEFRIKTLESKANKARPIYIPPLTIGSLPVGALVKDPNTKYNETPIVWRILEHNHAGDPVGTSTLESKDIITLKCFDARETGHPDDYVKATGNNRYRYSNLLQWLNADNLSSQRHWYQKTHQYDAPPVESFVAHEWVSGTEIAVNPYYNEYNGFMSPANFSAEFASEIHEAIKPTYCDEIEDYEDVTSKIFLLSAVEMAYEENQWTHYPNEEGSPYAYYNIPIVQPSDRQALRIKRIRDTAAVGNSPSKRAGSTNEYWLRTPVSSYGDNLSHVLTIGDQGLVGLSYGAWSSYPGVAPALCITSSLLVDRTPDTDGAYIIQF